jgi:hypothetical protein
MCERVATGFLCIRRDVIEKMVEIGDTLMVGNDPECPDLFPPQRVQVGERKYKFVGEDYAFCDLYRKAFPGELIYVWPDFDFTHGATYKGNFHNWLNKKAEENPDNNLSVAA